MKSTYAQIWLRPPIYEACLKGSDKFKVSVQTFIFHALEHYFGFQSSEHPFELRNQQHVQRQKTKQYRRHAIRESLKGTDPYDNPDKRAYLKALELLKKHGKL